MPSTVQEALVAEMLGDIGLLHEKVERLPDALREATEPALRSIALAVKEAKTTVDGYTKAQRPVIQQITATELAALRNAIKSEANEALSAAAQSLQASTQAHEASLQANRRQGIMLALVVSLVALMSSGIGVAGGYFLFGREQAEQAAFGRATLASWPELDAKTRSQIQKARQ